MNKSKISSILDKYSFVFEKSEIFSEFDDSFLYCINRENYISIVIKQYKEFDQINILNDVVRARGILKENNINIWNSYYLILIVNQELESETKIYNIERNSRGLRKYVILKEEDLYRLPFIKPLQSEKISLDFKTNFNEILETKNKEVTSILKWILESDGDLVDIKKQVIKDKISDIYWEGGLNEIK